MNARGSHVPILTGREVTTVLQQLHAGDASVDASGVGNGRENVVG